MSLKSRSIFHIHTILGIRLERKYEWSFRQSLFQDSSFEDLRSEQRENVQYIQNQLNNHPRKLLDSPTLIEYAFMNCLRYL